MGWGVLRPHNNLHDKALGKKKKISGTQTGCFLCAIPSPDEGKMPLTAGSIFISGFG